MLGLVLAIGLVVDDAIVVVEGVQRHIEEGLAPKDAALKAMKELSGASCGDCAGVGFGVRPYGVHSRHHAETLSTIRHDHRHFRDALRVQCAHSQPGARGPVARPKPEEGTYKRRATSWEIL